MDYIYIMMHEIKITPRGEPTRQKTRDSQSEAEQTIQSGDSAFSSSTVFSVESSSYVF